MAGASRSLTPATASSASSPLSVATTASARMGIRAARKALYFTTFVSAYPMPEAKTAPGRLAPEACDPHAARDTPTVSQSTCPPAIPPLDVVHRECRGRWPARSADRWPKAAGRHPVRSLQRWRSARSGCYLRAVACRTCRTCRACRTYRPSVTSKFGTVFAVIARS